jgi:hypothetical protein
MNLFNQLTRAQEYELSGLGFEKIIAPQQLQDIIMGVEEGYLVTLVGEEMYQEMISKRNPTDANYAPDDGLLASVVKMFPNDTNYENFWTYSCFAFLRSALNEQFLAQKTVTPSTVGVQQANTEFSKPADKNSVGSVMSAMSSSTNMLRNKSIRYLCKNRDLFPKLDLTICNNSCGCSSNNSNPTDAGGKAIPPQASTGITFHIF